MEKKYEKLFNIRGCRYAIKLTKRYKGIPGFAPEYHNIHIGDVVVKFLDGESPYFQTSDSTHIVLQREDIEEIKELMDIGFIEEQFTPTTVVVEEKK